MKQIFSARLLARTALLFASSAAGLLAQSDMASNTVLHATIPFTNLPSQSENGSLGNGRSSAVSNTLALAPKASSNLSSQPAIMPGTLAKDAAPAEKAAPKSWFSVQPDSLPLWVTSQPLAYLQYGAAPAVVRLQFGHK